MLCAVRVPWSIAYIVNLLSTGYTNAAHDDVLAEHIAKEIHAAGG